MNRLQAELQRLYLLPAAQREPGDSQEPGLIGADGRVRAMVLELARPARWDLLGKVWQGVQADLELPAPAIAVSGIDGYQLWFSLTEPVPATEAIDFLESLRSRYLGGVTQARIGMKPSADAAATGHAQHTGVAPPVEAAPGHWSAFVAPDLAALFADEPWLDIPPSPDAQAELLSRLQGTKPDGLKRALELLRPAVNAAGSTQAPPLLADAAGLEAKPVNAPSSSATGSLDPRRFLLDVMNDRAIELHLRIEAAKALLPYSAHTP